MLIYETTEYNAVDCYRSMAKALDGSFFMVGDTRADKGYGSTNITFMKVSY